MSDIPSTAGAALHPMAPEHLPYFIPTATGEDGMMGTALVLLVLGVMAFGVFYLHLHSLPERLAHGTNQTQWQLVAILALVALFTHENIFWLAALLLAAMQFPDFLTPIASGTRSLAILAKRDYEGDWDETGATEPAEDKPHVSVPRLFDDHHPTGLFVSPVRAGQTDRA